MVYKEEVRLMVAECLEQEHTRTQEEVLMGIFDIICRLSSGTANHCMRVSKYSKVLAMGMGMSADEAEKLRQAAMLHDLGKVILPSAIVEKPGKLTMAEYETIKQHVIHGYNFLSGAKGETLSLAAQIALEHHERWDGTGYLQKKRDEISLAARIVSAADVFDALISERCYKEPWPLDKAKAEIIKQGGAQFDPSVTEAFQKCFAPIVDVIPA